MLSRFVARIQLLVLPELALLGIEAPEFDAVMKRLKHVQAGRRFSRDEMNER